MKNIKIRLIEKDDLSDAAIIYTDAFNQAYPAENWTIESAKKLLQYYFKMQSDLFYIALQDNKIIGGVAGLIKPWWNGLCFSDGELFVKPDLQSKGIGKKLFQEVIKKAQEKYNISGVQGITDGKKKFPLVWYERLGLKRSGYVHIEGSAKDILENLE